MPQDESKKGEIGGPISDSECIKIREYARRIRTYTKFGKERIALYAYIQVLQATNFLCLLPELNTLRVYHGASEDEIPFLVSPSLQKAHRMARNLTHLDISASFTTASFRSISSMRRLQTLNIFHVDITNRCELDLDFLRTLASSESLKFIHLGFPTPLKQDGLSSTNDRASCASQVLVIDIPIFLEFSLDQLTALLLCWKNLKTLTLKTQTLPFQALVRIAQTLPTLHELSLTIEAQGLFDVDSVPVLGHRLNTLFVYGNLEEPLNIVRLIDRIFPYLDDSEFSPNNDPEGEFFQAPRLLQVLRDARQDERKRCQTA
ncbi:unnamed protein product [Cyclocybe aegerita]|uniref:F-box domain-containing protein n=1 Tax=Cyclocybe aegerita TaxID=1973307 RepID=A0A8S0WBA6_CYCAE|nr:unnamed protein product [Cyclocybe aegerita]